MRTLIRDGTVVTSADTVPADVLVDGEHIAGLAAPGTHDWERTADRVLDARGRYVLPGGVDLHTHMELPVSGTVSSDDFESGSRAALVGGTTTIVDYAGQDRGGTLTEALERWQERAAGRTCVDYGFHIMVTDVHDGTLEEMGALVADGVTSFKLFTAYPDTNYCDDAQILRAMQAAAELDATIMMHAENGIAIDVLREQAVARGDTDPIHHLLTRPPSLEAEAVHRVVALAEVAGCSMVIVHISSADAAWAAAAGRERGLPVYGETCPQYLWLGIEDVPEGFEAAKFVCSPPLRWRRDGHQDALWEAISAGRLDVVATDHCPFSWAQKEAGRGDFTKIPNGLGVVEHRLDLVHQGVVDERLTLNRWVDACATAPAKLAGLHPRKGALAPGSDADIVLYDPRARQRLSAATHHMRVDYSVFEGLELTGRVETVLLRGQVVVDDGEHVGAPGDGRYLRRGPNGFRAPVRAPADGAEAAASRALDVSASRRPAPRPDGAPA
jgi:dihydropyrimidinase